jgi:hypothetical protein
VYNPPLYSPLRERQLNQRFPYYCEPIRGAATPGIEHEYDPEIHELDAPDIFEIKWFDLRSVANWDSELVNDPINYNPLQRIRKKLGYLL